MLKIKDNVDLKELEKYGFKKETNGAEQWYSVGRLFDRYTEVELPSRYIKIYTADDREIHEDILYDLIKADLVEKVEE